MTENVEYLTVHDCADCDSPKAVVLDDGLNRPLCDACRQELYDWLDECVNADEAQRIAEMEYAYERAMEDKYDGMKCGDYD